VHRYKHTDYRAPCVYTSCLVCNHRSNQPSIPANIAWTSARQRGGARWRVRIGGASDDQLSNARNPLHTFFRKFPVDGETANLLWTCCRLSRRLSYHIISYHIVHFSGASSKTPAPQPLNKQVSFQHSAVLQMFLQWSVGSRMPAGKLFQMRGPATANDLSHSAVLVRGTHNTCIIYSSEILIAVNNDNKFKQNRNSIKTMWH